MANGACEAGSMIVVLEGNLKIDGQPARAGEAGTRTAAAIELKGRGDRLT